MPVNQMTASMSQPTFAPPTRGTLPRVDGPLKVTGTAQYTSDYRLADMAYAVPVRAGIARGSVLRMETERPEQMPGVCAVLTHANCGPIYSVGPGGGRIDEHRPPLSDNEITYYGQFIAVVVAETLEQATAAAAAVRVTYRSETPDVRRELAPDKPAHTDSMRGDAELAFAAAAVHVDETYATPTETHNPIELHASTASWDGESFTLYETTQAVVNHRDVLAQMLGVGPENVRVISRFLGSGFGGKLWPWTQSVLAAVASRKLGRPVKLVVSRESMFETVGHRPRTQQRIRLGSTSDGKLTAVLHDYINATSMLESYRENCGEATGHLYSTPNLLIRSSVAPRNIGAPTSMRGPGAVPGLFALESGMDELAIALKLDPVELRLRNDTLIDESLKLPFSSRHLKECLSVGAERFGWANRTAQPGSMQREGLILGWGVAACSWIAERAGSEVVLELCEDGTVKVASATQDLGTGTYTVMVQVVAEALGISYSRVEPVLGDTRLPPGPVSGGSTATASLIPGLLDAVANTRRNVLSLAVRAKSGPLSGKKQEELVFSGGMIHLADSPASTGVPFERVIRQANLRSVSGTGKSSGMFGGGRRTASTHSFGAHFVEVTWQPDIARLRVSKVVTVIDAGRIVNPKPARNQIEGAVVMGIGMALFEETRYEDKFGLPINNNLADYIMATHADAPPIDVAFLDYPDKILNELGARGVGEIGLAGVAPAITSAIFHATGKRIRKLPVTIEDLL